MLDINSSVLILIDFQGAFASAIPGFSIICSRASILRKAAEILHLPCLITEQYPEKLQPTVDIIELSGADVFSKVDFSGFNVLKESLTSLNKKNIILCGLEAHVCVLQTCLDLIYHGYSVHLVTDACGSRDNYDRNFAFQRLEKSGVTLSTLETVLFELLKTKDHKNFKEIQRLIIKQIPRPD